MKKITLLIVTTILVLSCKDNTVKKETIPADTFKVFGTLKGLDVPYIFIDYTHDVTGDRVWDTIKVKNEHFSYNAKIKNTKRVAIWPMLNSKEGMGKNGKVEFLVRPGDAIEYKGEVTETFDAIPTGTSLCDDINTFNKSTEQLNKKASKIMGNIRALTLKLIKEESYHPSQGMHPKVQVKYDSLKTIGEEIAVIKKNFVKERPKSEVAAYYLSKMVTLKEIPDNDALTLLNAFDNTVKTSPFYIDVATRLKGSETTKSGNVVPELVSNRTLDGKEFNLKSLRGKYVLIDFWGTWCGPCVAEMPKVKEYSETYKDNLVIVGVNSGDTKQRIIDFVTPKGYNWVQLLSKKGVNDDNFVSKFNISGFPTKFIIDPNGIIIEKYIGGSEEAFEKLDEILKDS
ncbi:TlpA disulfide reductase family protein [Cellulophaga lytica]|uniref:TlpA family protein disulfide reductase n=1 Tax=Cellulophaga lytica TaxID=979 RepID=UPI0026E2F718|nr:TlpA disulfide reductase family protein [Cellulophaga lytica]MDO6854740.1 TlpA disulfide reductase family protein [Cellulophaga lytica]